MRGGRRAPATQRKQDERPSQCAGWPRARIQRYRIQLAYMIRSFVWSTGPLSTPCPPPSALPPAMLATRPFAKRPVPAARTPPHRRAEAGGAPPAPWEPVCGGGGCSGARWRRRAGLAPSDVRPTRPAWLPRQLDGCCYDRLYFDPYFPCLGIGRIGGGVPSFETHPTSCPTDGWVGHHPPHPCHTVATRRSHEFSQKTRTRRLLHKIPY